MGTLTRGACGTEREQGTCTKETRADRSAPPGRGRGGARTRGHENDADRRGPAVSEGGRTRAAG